MQNSLVSVVIPAYKPDFIIETINSVLSQTYLNIEVVVVDDGSPYNLKALLNELIQAKKIRYFYQENKKMGAAKNTGIRNSRGEFIAFVDDDDLWGSNKIEKQIPLFRNSSIGMVYSLADELLCDGKIRQRAKYKNCEFRGKIIDQLFFDNFIPNSSVVVSKECISKIGGFNESPQYYGIDDYELWLRIAHSFEIELVSERLIKVRVHDKQVSGNFKFMAFQELNVKKQLAKNFHIKKSIRKKAYSHLLFNIAYNENSVNHKYQAFKYFILSALNDLRLVQVKELIKLFIPNFIKKSLSKKLAETFD
jgi:glycosyltransferase involved in cell wall biosynthesis